VPPKQKLAVTVGAADDRRAAIEALSEPIWRLAGVSSLDVVAPETAKADGATRAVVAGGFVEIPLAGAVDVEAERSRIGKRLADATALADRSAKKLGNEGFLAKAAPDVVAAEREKLERLEAERDQLRSQLDELG
jgi:valyl-tRNA synthetase